MPLLAGGLPVGALNVFAKEPGGLCEEDVLLARRIAAPAAATLANANARAYRRATRLAGQLEDALTSRCLIERAKGVLMATQRATSRRRSGGCAPPRSNATSSWSGSRSRSWSGPLRPDVRGANTGPLIVRSGGRTTGRTLRCAQVENTSRWDAPLGWYPWSSTVSHRGGHVSYTQKPLVGYFVQDRPGAIGRARAIVPRITSRVALFQRGTVEPPLDELTSIHPAAPPADAIPVVDQDDEAVLGPQFAARLARWVEEEQPSLLVVDGPLDVALLGRLIGVPVVPVRHPFAGVGPAAGAVHDLAASWLAPFPAALEPLDTPPEIRRRTVHAGFVSRFEGRRLGQRAARRRIGVDEDARHVTVLAGSDGLGLEAAAIERAAATASAWTFSVLGPCSGVRATSSNVRFEGWCDDVFPHLVAADVIIAGSSCSAIADAAAASRPLALVPGDDVAGRALADALEELGAAVVLDAWPSAVAWPALLADLLDLPTRGLRSLSDGRASRRAARWVDAWAAAPPADPTQARAATAVLERDALPYGYPGAEDRPPVDDLSEGRSVSAHEEPPANAAEPLANAGG